MIYILCYKRKLQIEFAANPTKKHSGGCLCQFKLDARSKNYERIPELSHVNVHRNYKHQLIDKHRNQNHELLIITATNRFIVEPIAAEFKIKNLIACEPEFNNNQFTGEFTGIPSYAEGKVERFNDWLKHINCQPEESWFYSDSHNDIPLMKEVNHPIAVDPDDSLKNEAIKMDWPIISLR